MALTKELSNKLKAVGTVFALLVVAASCSTGKSDTTIKANPYETAQSKEADYQEARARLFAGYRSDAKVGWEEICEGFSVTSEDAADCQQAKQMDAGVQSKSFFIMVSANRRNMNPDAYFNQLEAKAQKTADAHHKVELDKQLADLDKKYGK